MGCESYLYAGGEPTPDSHFALNTTQLPEEREGFASDLALIPGPEMFASFIMRLSGRPSASEIGRVNIHIGFVVEVK